MRRAARLLGSLLAAGGVLALAWVLCVWLWQDPFTAAYTTWQQHKLAHQYNHLVAEWAPQRSAQLAASSTSAIPKDAARFRRQLKTGQAIGRITIPRIGLNIIVVYGTDESSLERGPGLDQQTYLPGQDRLVYIAGHRTTYLAPFAHIDSIRVGDLIHLDMPYASFTYRATRHFVVPADDLAMLKSPNHELLRLQACHPRFFATHRYIVDAKLVAVTTRVRKS